MRNCEVSQNHNILWRVQIALINVLAIHGARRADHPFENELKNVSNWKLYLNTKHNYARRRFLNIENHLCEYDQGLVRIYYTTTHLNCATAASEVNGISDVNNFINRRQLIIPFCFSIHWLIVFNSFILRVILMSLSTMY